MNLSPPHIWYVAHYAGGPGVGRHNRGWYLSKNWTKQGASSTVIVANNHHMLDAPQPAGYRDVDGVAYEFVKSPPYRGNGLGRLWNMAVFTIRFYRHAEKLAKVHGRPDMVIATSPHPFSFLATHLVARRFGAKSVFEVRDLWPASLTEVMDVPGWHPVVKAIAAVERYAYRTADAVVSLLPKTKGYMEERGLVGDRWYFIPNGIDQNETIERLQPSELTTQLETWRREDRCVIAYTGALGVPNNLDILIDALAKARQEDANVRVAVVGRGETEERLKKKADDLRLQGSIRFFGQVSRKQALSLLSQVDVGFVSLKPSGVFQFGISPNKIYDYMLTGIPIISAISSGNDIVADARCGFSIKSNDPVDVANCIVKMSQMSRSARLEMGQAGRRYALSNFSYDHLAEAYLSILKRPG